MTASSKDPGSADLHGQQIRVRKAAADWEKGDGEWGR